MILIIKHITKKVKKVHRFQAFKFKGGTTNPSQDHPSQVMYVSYRQIVKSCMQKKEQRINELHEESVLLLSRLPQFGFRLDALSQAFPHLHV